MNPLKLLGEKWNPPAEVKKSFEGQVVLVTGANTGLGLEAAKKVAALGADKLIVTTRSEAKGEATKSQIKQWLADTKRPERTEIIHIVLDMGSSTGVKAFMEGLNSTSNKLDAAILNAGMNTPEYRTSPEGFEEVLQVNTISTVFLATLLLPLLTATAKSSKTQTHLTFSSSRNATLGASFPKDQSTLSSSTPLKEMSQPQRLPAGIAGGLASYGRSKLMLEYVMRRMVYLPALRSTDAKPSVIINSVCPGMTKSDLGRNYKHWAVRVFAQVLFVVFAKSAEAGANAYLQALTQGEESMGQLWAAGHFVEEWDALRSEQGRRLGDTVWEEMKALMQGWDGSVAEILDQKV